MPLVEEAEDPNWQAPPVSLNVAQAQPFRKMTPPRPQRFAAPVEPLVPWELFPVNVQWENVAEQASAVPPASMKTTPPPSVVAVGEEELPEKVAPETPALTADPLLPSMASTPPLVALFPLKLPPLMVSKPAVW